MLICVNERRDRTYNNVPSRVNRCFIYPKLQLAIRNYQPILAICKQCYSRRLTLLPELDNWLGVGCNC